MTRSNLPKSLRKYIRLEKARIRREVSDFKKQQELIQKLYERIFDRYRKKTTEKEAVPAISKEERLTQQVITAKEQ